jgi:hypothetical protein
MGCRWRTTPAGSLRLIARFLPVGESHTKVTVVAFEKLRSLLA